MNFELRREKSLFLALVVYVCVSVYPVCIEANLALTLQPKTDSQIEKAAAAVESVKEISCPESS